MCGRKLLASAFFLVVKNAPRYVLGAFFCLKGKPTLTSHNGSLASQFDKPGLHYSIDVWMYPLASACCTKCVRTPRNGNPGAFFCLKVKPKPASTTEVYSHSSINQVSITMTLSGRFPFPSVISFPSVESAPRYVRPRGVFIIPTSYNEGLTSRFEARMRTTI